MAYPIQSSPNAGSTVLQIADKLGDTILAGSRPGSLLPSEAAIAAEFGVSRLTIREALKILAGRGLIRISRGRRAMVTRPDGTMFGAFLTSLIKSDPKNLIDLLQVRRSLEIQSVILAARHASRSGLKAIEVALDAMRAAATRLEVGAEGPEAELTFHAADVRFHEALVLSGGNRVLTFLFEAMESSLMEEFLTSHRGLGLEGKNLTDLCDAHAAILRSVAAHDEKASVEAMTAILDTAEVNLRKAIEGL